MSKDPIWSKPRTLKELAAYYEVDKRTLKKWLSCPTLANIRPETGYYFSVNQIKTIIKHLGSNEEIFEETQTSSTKTAVNP